MRAMDFKGDVFPKTSSLLILSNCMTLLLHLQTGCGSWAILPLTTIVFGGQTKKDTFDESLTNYGRMKQR